MLGHYRRSSRAILQTNFANHEPFQNQKLEYGRQNRLLIKKSYQPRRPHSTDFRTL